MSSVEAIPGLALDGAATGLEALDNSGTGEGAGAETDAACGLLSETAIGADEEGLKEIPGFPE